MSIKPFDKPMEKEVIDSANATSEWISKCKTKEEFLKNFKSHEYDEYSKLGESMLECHFVVCVTAWNKNIKFTKDDYEQMKHYNLKENNKNVLKFKGLIRNEFVSHELNEGE